MSIVSEKFKEVFFSVLPFAVIVLILHFTVTPIDTPVLIRFLMGTVLVVLGMTVFLFGIEIGITPLGIHMGTFMTKSNKLWVLAVLGILLGFFTSVAEPDLHILAGQVQEVTGGALSKMDIVIIVSSGIALLLTIGLIRIVHNFPLNKLLILLYSVIFILALFTSPGFLAISFDASGATTGALTVPFMLALAQGVSALKKDSKASETDSFGLVGVTSIGAIISIMLMSIFTKNDELTGSLAGGTQASSSVFLPFAEQFSSIAVETLFTLLPIFLIAIIFQKKAFKLSKKAFVKVLKGVLYTYMGLVLFLTGVNAGFMDVGRALGKAFTSFDNTFYLLSIGFVLGILAILAEPAVYVLIGQIENVTSGYVKKGGVMLALSVGVGIAVSLSLLRIVVPEIQLWHYLLPGYAISLLLSLFTPQLFVGIAFDSGGIASGTMTATFILAFSQGAAEALEGANVLVDGFGIIAMVALIPLIALQILGLVFKIKSSKRGIQNG